MEGDLQDGGDNIVNGEYRWSSPLPEQAHSYLDNCVLRALGDAVSAGRSNVEPLRIFDAGCGNGALLRKLQQIGHVVAGCELASAGVTIARQSLGPNVKIERMSVYDDLACQFGANWDVVVSTEVIEHLYDPRLFVRRIKEILSPTGTLILSTPYHGYLKNLALALSGAWDRHLTALWDGGHIKFWSYDTLKTLLIEQDFGDFRFYGAGRLPGLWKSMVVSCRLTSTDSEPRQ